MKLKKDKFFIEKMKILDLKPLLDKINSNCSQNGSSENLVYLIFLFSPKNERNYHLKKIQNSYGEKSLYSPIYSKCKRRLSVSQFQFPPYPVQRYMKVFFLLCRSAGIPNIPFNQRCFIIVLWGSGYFINYGFGNWYWKEWRDFS